MAAPNNQPAVVAGAGSGIGKIIVLSLAERVVEITGLSARLMLKFN